MGKELKTISVWDTTKEMLDGLKVHHQQSYDDLLQLLMREHIKNKEEDGGEDVLE